MTDHTLFTDFLTALQKKGGDRVLEQKASTFFGMFSWSEVGFAAFSGKLFQI